MTDVAARHWGERLAENLGKILYKKLAVFGLASVKNCQ